MTDRRLLWLAGALILAETMFYSMLVPLFPHYRDEFDLSKSAVGLLAAFYSIGSLAFAVPAGFMTSKLGAKRTVATGVFVLAGASLAFGLSGTTPTLFASRLIQGAAAGTIWVGSLSWLVGSTHPGRRGEVVGTAVGIGIVGSLIGPVLGAAATEVGVAVAFGAVALFIAALGLWTLGMPQSPPGDDVTMRELVAAARAELRLGFGVWITALCAVMFGLVEVLGPLRLDDLGAGAFVIAAAFITATLVEALLSPSFGRWADRHGPSRVARVGLLGSVLLAPSLVLPHTVALYCLLVVLALLSIAMPSVPASILLSRGVERAGIGQGIAFALWNVGWSSGLGLGSGLGVAVAERTGDAAPLVFLALLSAGTAALLTWGAASRMDRGR